MKRIYFSTSTNSAYTILAQLLTTVWHIGKSNILQKIAPNQYSHLQLHWAYRRVKFENIQFDLI
jgi:thiamine biosynthesis lipoprotein ApbE